MSESNPQPTLTPKPRLTGVQTVFQYTGLPPSLLQKRPKLPSRNWLIFISFVTSLTGLYVYDRRECKRIRAEYVNRVKDLAEQPLHKFDWVRKVTVYGCRWPEDYESDRSIKYFKKYVKPVFVAAALDFECVNGKQYGELRNRVADEIKRRRRIAAGLEPPKAMVPGLAGDRSLEAEQQREQSGGVVVIGRHTFKEYMEGLRRGWSESVYASDREDQLARQLQNDGIFDEKDGETLDDHSGTAVTPSLPASQPKPVALPKPVEPLAFPPAPNQALSPFTALRRQPVVPPVHPRPAFVDEPPSVLPFHAPIGLVPYTNHLGFLQIPYMIYGFFTQRYHVQSGCEAGYRIVCAHTRNIHASDLEFDLNSERYIKGSFAKLPRRVEKAREEYYREVAKKLKIARELARGEREPTKAEMANPPPTEVELRAERIKKELKWTSDTEGWEILKKPLAWDERFRTVLRVFDDPPSSAGIDLV